MQPGLLCGATLLREPGSAGPWCRDRLYARLVNRRLDGWCVVIGDDVCTALMVLRGSEARCRQAIGRLPMLVSEASLALQGFVRE